MKSLTILMVVLLCMSSSLDAEDFWRQTDGPYGGNIFAIECDVNGYMFAATSEDGGVFRSSDNGATWEQVNTGLEGNRVHSFAVGPEGSIYAGTRYDGVFRSNDGGGSWTQVGLGGQTVYALAMHSNGSLFAGGNGVSRSTDGGDSWTAPKSLPSPSVRGLSIGPDGELVAATWDGVFCSLDGGDSWTLLGLNWINWCVAINAQGEVFVGWGGGVSRTADQGDHWTHSYLGSDVFSLAVDSQGDLFAATDRGGVFRSEDGGENWSPVNAGLTNHRVYSIATSAGGNVFAGTFGGGVFRSDDGGDSWSAASHGLSRSDIWSLVANARGHVLAGTAGGGVLGTTDAGAGWQPLNNGVASANIYALAVSESGYLFAGADYPDALYRSADSGATWKVSGTGISYRVVVALATGRAGRVFCGTPSSEDGGGGIFRSSDHGVSWNSTPIRDQEVFSLAINDAGHIFAGVWGGAIRSTDDGETWTDINEGLMPPGVSTLAVDPTGRLFAGTSNGVFRSLDNGDHWNPTGLSGVWVSSIAVNSMGHLFAGSQFGVQRSTDHGEHWVPINEGLTTRSVRCLAVDPDGYLYAGTQGGGVFASLGPTVAVDISELAAVQDGNDVVLTWRTAHESEVSAFRVYRSDAGGPLEPLRPDITPQTSKTYTYRDVDPGPGRYGYRIGEVGPGGDVHLHAGVELEIKLRAPMASFLDPATPNPFNPMTSLRFGVAQPGPIRLAIYDVRGRLVRRLLNSTNAAAGTYSVAWDGLDDRNHRVTSGTYRVRLDASGRSFARTLTLVK